MVTTIGRRKIIGVILTVLIWGLGHAYIGRIKRGIGLFLLGLAIMLVVSFLLPWPLPLFVGSGYVLWLISDLFRMINREAEPVSSVRGEKQYLILFYTLWAKGGRRYKISCLDFIELCLTADN